MSYNLRVRARIWTWADPMQKPPSNCYTSASQSVVPDPETAMSLGSVLETQIINYLPQESGIWGREVQ